MLGTNMFRLYCCYRVWREVIFELAFVAFAAQQFFPFTFHIDFQCFTKWIRKDNNWHGAMFISRLNLNRIHTYTWTLWHLYIAGCSTSTINSMGNLTLFFLLEQAICYRENTHHTLCTLQFTCLCLQFVVRFMLPFPTFSPNWLPTNCSYFVLMKIPI